MDDIDSRLSPLLKRIAHDVKGLLGTPGLLIHLAETAQGEELQTLLASLRESFKAVDRTLTDIGDVGSAIGPVAAPGAQRTDVRELLAGVLAAAKNAGVQRRVELVEEISPGPWPPVLADPATLMRGLERLVFWGVTHAASNSRLVIAGEVADGSVRVRVPAGRGTPDAVPTVRERLQELQLGSNEELRIALPLAREAFERSGGSLAVGADGILEARIPAA